jgi:hypothetical protein
MEYATDTFTVLRAAFLELCEDAIYLETESELGPENPCPDYVTHLRESSRAINDAKTLADLVSVPWISGKAALALDAIG